MAILHVCNVERYVFFCIYLKFFCIDTSGRPVFFFNLYSPTQKALLLREAASLRLSLIHYPAVERIIPPCC